ncbi:hypothetical protein JCM9279_005794 [Rhodotorula babjevae]
MPLPDESHRLAFPKMPDLHAWIVVDGEPVELYATDEMRARGEAYVEAATGKTFEIGIADLRSKRPTFSWNVDIYADGDWSDGIVTEKSSTVYGEPVDDRVWVREGFYHLNNSTIRRYRFAELQPAEAADDALSARDAKKIGCIELHYLRITHVRHVAAKSFGFDDEQAVLEEDCKAELSHRVGFGEEEPSDQVEDMGATSFKRKDPIRKPYSRLRIFYRSRPFLQAQALVPMSDDSESDLEISTPPPRKRRRTDTASPSPAIAAAAAATALASKKARLAELQEQLVRAQAEVDELEQGGALEQKHEEDPDENQFQREDAPPAPLKPEEEQQGLRVQGAEVEESDAGGPAAPRPAWQLALEGLGGGP